MTASTMTSEDAAERGTNPNVSPNAYPRLATLWAALVYIVSALTLGWPALSGQFLVGSHSDQYIAGYPFREFAARTLRETGSFPLWNPYQFGGMPYVAAMHGDIFYPTFLLRMILPTDVAMTWGFIIHLVLAGLFTFVLLRRIGFGFAGALIGGIAYMMSGQVASLVSPGHDGKMFVSALFPILIWSLIAGIRDGRRWAWGVLSLVVGLDFLSPHPQLLQYSLLAGGAYAIYLATREAKARRLTNVDALKRLAFALGGVVLGAVIGAVQFLPVREYVAWSPRASGIGSYERATSFAWNPQELFNVYLPQFSGMLDAYWGPNGIHFHSDYVGVVTLMLAGAAFLGLRSDSKRGEIWFWTIILIVTLLWSLGAATPFYKLPYYLIPGTKYFRAPATIFFVGTLGISVLVASGVDKILAGRVGTKYVIGWLVFAALVTVLAVTGGLTNFAGSIAPQEIPGAYERVLANNGALIGGSLRALLFIVLTAAVVFTIGTGKLPSRAAAAALAILCAADLWSIEREYWFFSPPAAQTYASNPAIDFLRKQPQPVRVFSVAAAETDDPATYSGSGLMVHDIRNVGGYHGNQLGRYNMLTGADGGANEMAGRILMNPNGQRLTNLQYILTNSDKLAEAIPNAGLKLVLGPVKDAHGEDTYVYKLPLDAPFAWLAPVIIKAPDDQVLQTVLDPRFDVTRAAVFDTSAPVTAQSGVSTLPPATNVQVHVDKYEPGHVLMTLSAPAPAGSALLASENYYPGWTAKVDGTPAKIGRAQYTLIGVELPAGARRIELSFDSPVYKTGKMLTWIALLLTALAIVGGLVAERRRSE